VPSPMDVAVIAAGSALPFLVNEATKGTKGGAHSTGPGQSRLPSSGDKQGSR
jgi:hypothetical protein